MKDARAELTETSPHKWLSRGEFLFRKYVTGFRVGGEPHLDRHAFAHLKDVIARTTRYLEYGSGGSTLLACQTAKVVVTVDNDRRFLRGVVEAISSSPAVPDLFVPIYVDTGITQRWGVPVFRTPTPKRVLRWRRYAQAPWEIFRAHSIEPDTILVDGRFRAACVLESLLNLGADSACVILVDDYVGRHEYAVVEAFADRVAMFGKMATLRKKPDFDREECLRIVPHFYRDWR